MRQKMTMPPHTEIVVPDESWARLVEIHNHAKSIFLLAEEFDSRSNDFIQPAMELRHGLEHIVRAQAVILGISDGDDEPNAQYVLHSFDKAIGHEYRAFFDAADWLSVSIRQRINETLEPYSHECIEAVITDYYPTLRPRVDRICVEIAAIRGAKDVVRNTDIDAKVGKSEETIAEIGTYRKIIDELVSISERIQCSVPSLVDWTRKNRRSTFKGWILGALIGSTVTAIITWVFRLGSAKP
jgi:hypothetical protein